MSGQGVMRYPNGNKFVGRFSNDQRAEGEETMTDGTVIKAKYKNDKKEDKQGRVIYPNKTLSGPFVNDMLHGRVEVKYAGGKMNFVDYVQGKEVRRN